MGHYHDKMIAQLVDYENGLETNSSELTLDNISQTSEKLYSIISKLQSIHNSKLTINRLVPCVLYNIFAFAAYDSGYPGLRPEGTVLSISHVCRRWRDLALGWPILWAFFSLRRPPSIVELFMNRSENTPLTLSWTIHKPSPSRFRGYNSSTKLYLKTYKESILPRLCSLSLHLHHSQFSSVQKVFHNGMRLSLRYLDIRVEAYGPGNRGPPSLKDTLRTDISSLRGLTLSHIDWPWFELPHHNLTYIIIHNPTEPPSLSTFLIFLSNCPLLRELRYRIGDANSRIPIITTTLPTSASRNSLNFPYLERLTLGSKGPSGYGYIKGISEHLGALGRLSQFVLFYRGCMFPSSGIFESIPSGTFSHFSGHSYLSMSITSDSFVIKSAPNSVLTSEIADNLPLYISGTGTCSSLFIEGSPIFKLIREVSQIVHLVLIGDAWNFLTLPNIRDELPCLRILEMHDLGDEALSSLRNGSKLQTLFLGLGDSPISFEILLDIIPRTGAKLLKLDTSFCHKHHDNPEFAKTIAALRESGVSTVSVTPSGEDVLGL